MLTVYDQSKKLLQLIFGGHDPAVARQAMEIDGARIEGLWQRVADIMNSPGSDHIVIVCVCVCVYGGKVGEWFGVGGGGACSGTEKTFI